MPVGDTVMHAVSFGYGKKPLILLPGLSDGLMTVKGKALMLAEPYRMFFDDYTVYMFSRKDTMPAGCTIRDMADDQAYAMEVLGLRGAAVVGVSEGGMIAQVLAAQYPDLVEKLVLVVTASCVNEISEVCVRRWIGFAKQGDHKSLMIDTAENSYSEAYLKKYRKMYPVLGKVGKLKTYERFLRNAEAILQFDASDVLKQIRCPVLIIGGEKDRIVGPEASRVLHEAIPGSTLYMYPDYGHAAYEEAGDFYPRIREFLKQ